MSKVIKFTFLLIGLMSAGSSQAAGVSSNFSANLWPWYLTRASGLVAYVLLFVLVVSGIGIKTSKSFKFISPTFAWLNHRYLGIALSFSVAIHLTFLLIDRYLKLTLADVFVPFFSSYKPLFLSLGIFGFYLLLLVIVSSIFTINKYPKTWRLLHYLPYPMFVILFIHGYFLGSDTKSLLVQLIYLFTALVTFSLSLYRLYFFYKQK